VISKYALQPGGEVAIPWGANSHVLMVHGASNTPFPVVWVQHVDAEIDVTTDVRYLACTRGGELTGAHVGSSVDASGDAWHVYSVEPAPTPEPEPGATGATGP